MNAGSFSSVDEAKSPGASCASSIAPDDTANTSTSAPAVRHARKRISDMACCSAFRPPPDRGLGTDVKDVRVPENLRIEDHRRRPADAAAHRDRHFRRDEVDRGQLLAEDPLRL